LGEIVMSGNFVSFAVLYMKEPTQQQRGKA
jgi:hypothetical protein